MKYGATMRTAYGDVPFILYAAIRAHLRQFFRAQWDDEVKPKLPWWKQFLQYGRTAYVDRWVDHYTDSAAHPSVKYKMTGTPYGDKITLYVSGRGWVTSWSEVFDQPAIHKKGFERKATADEVFVAQMTTTHRWQRKQALAHLQNDNPTEEPCRLKQM